MSNNFIIRKATIEDFDLLKDLDSSFSQNPNEILKFYLKKHGVFIVERRRSDRVEAFLLSQILNWVNKKRKLVWIEHIYKNTKSENQIINELLEYTEDYYKHLIPDIEYIFGNVMPSDKEILKNVERIDPISFFGKF